MSEFLLSKENSSENSQKMSTHVNMDSEDEYTSETKKNLFEFDIVADTLKHIYSKSKLKKRLSLALATFYTYPILIILFSFLIGFLFFGLSMLFIYFKIFNNFMKPIIFIIFLTIFFSLLILTVRIIDDLKNKGNIGAKWERNNILKNIGLSLTLIILVVAAFFFHSFFNDLLTYKNNSDIQLEYEENENVDNNNNQIKYQDDFFLKYIINCFLLEPEEIKNENIKVHNYLGNSLLKEIHWSLLKCCIPLCIFCFIKLIKLFLIEIKYTIPRFIVFINCLFFIILIFVDHKFIDKKDFDWFIISLIEIILLSLIYIGYILWIVCSVYKLNKNPKDKSFTINKFDLCPLLLIFAFDLINIFSSTFIYLSLLLNYINYVYNNETYKDLSNIFFYLKIGFLLSIISNSLYYGHHLLSLIFRPIALQYAPAKIKKYYIRPSWNLSAILSLNYDL